MSRSSTRLLISTYTLATVVITSILLESASAAWGGGIGSDGKASPQFVIEKSTSGKSLYGISASTGRWAKLSATPYPEDGLFPHVVSRYAAVRGANAVHAFSPITGTWASIDTEVEPQLILSSGLVACTAANKIFAYSPKAGKWAQVFVGAPAELHRLEVSIDMVLYREGNRVFAFSADTGTWDEADLEQD